MLTGNLMSNELLGLVTMARDPDTSMYSPASIWMSTEALPEDPDDQDLVNTTALVPSFL